MVIQKIIHVKIILILNNIEIQQLDLIDFYRFSKIYEVCKISRPNIDLS